MYSKDHPDQLKFERKETTKQKLDQMESYAKWDKYLHGNALIRYLSKFKVVLPTAFLHPHGVLSKPKPLKLPPPKVR
jgi:hypothetical protein